MIELYIENKKIDLRDDIEISIVAQAIDPNKLSSIKNSFSKTVNVPGTKNNNDIFGYIFRNDKQIPENLVGSPIGIFYDPHKKVNYFITENGSFINRGYCTLDNIIIKNTYEVEYKLTLYGGIGEFFYSLFYNEDGTVKTLYDLYWNWKGLHNSGYDSQALTPDQENSGELYYCSLVNVTSSYHRLNPEYQYDGTTDIDKDVVFVPCYTGLYEDFDSKHMLVCDYNWGAAHSGSIVDEYVSSETIDILRASFPSVISEESKLYSTVGKTFSSIDNYTFGLATFSRDIDPYEAGDLRINELPIAIRLSKLLWRISQPENNGGYEVQWDPSVLNSLYWKYGWVLLGKIKQENKKVVYASVSTSTTTPNNIITINWNQNTTAVSPNIVSERTMTISGWYENDNSLNFNQQFSISPSQEANSVSSIANQPIVSGSWFYDGSTTPGPHGGYIQTIRQRTVSNYLCLLTEVYDGSTLKSSNLDVFFFYDFEFSQSNDVLLISIGKSAAKNQGLVDKVNNYLGTSLTTNQITTHWCNIKYNTYSSGVVNFNTMTENIKVNIPANVSSPSIVQKQFYMYNWRYYSSVGGHPAGNEYLFGIYGVDCPTLVNPFFNVMRDAGTTIWKADNPNITLFNINITGSWISGDTVEGYSNISLTKKLMLADTETPMKYLTDFCKMMNLSFECDNTSKKIYIFTKKNYYNGLTYDITDRIDHSRDISIKNVLTQAKTINVGFETPESYPVHLFNKNVKNKFNDSCFETGIEYNIKEERLFENNIFKNTIDWQQQSIFYNIFPQIPKPYNSITVSWTLWEYSNDEHSTKEFILGGISPLNPASAPAYDFMPKNSLFDKDNKAIEAYPSFIFLNGFIKNFDYKYSKPGDGNLGSSKDTICPRLTFSNDISEQFTLNGQRCYIYAFNYGTNILFYDYGFYQINSDYIASSWVLPFFTRDLYNVYNTTTNKWEYAGSTLASWNINYQEGLNNLYGFTSNTEFIQDPNYSYPKQISGGTIIQNHYSINVMPQFSTTGRIYDIYWKPWLAETYDRNSREVTCYIDLTGLGDINSLMRNFYGWNGSLWVITKIDGYRLNNFGKDKFTKVTLKKVINLENYKIEI